MLCVLAGAATAGGDQGKGAREGAHCEEAARRRGQRAPLSSASRGLCAHTCRPLQAVKLAPIRGRRLKFHHVSYAVIKP